MAKWDERDIGTEQCPECGELYNVTIINLPLRDEDDFKCACGYTMRSWNGTISYNYKHRTFDRRANQLVQI